MDRRDFMKGSLGIAALGCLGGCATGVHLTPTGNYLLDRQQIINSPMSEGEKERAYEQLIGGFRNSTREENFNPVERQWAQDPYTRQKHSLYFQSRVRAESGDEGLEWFRGIVNFDNPSPEDAVFMLRYEKAARIRRR